MMLHMFAYVDPGAGTMLVQLVAATCAGALAVFRHKILAPFRKKKPAEPSAGSETTAESDKNAANPKS